MDRLWNKIFGKSKEISLSCVYGDNEAAISRYMKRLSEIHEEISGIGYLFEESSRQTDIEETNESIEEAVALVNKLRVPGYCAYKLAEEGLILVHLLSIKIALLKSADNKSDAKLDKVIEHLDVSELGFKQILGEMAPYKSMRGEDILVATIERISDKNP